MKKKKEKFTDKLMKAMKKKEQDLLKGVKFGFVHFDSVGKMTPLEDLKDINWIDYDENEKM
jgi:hypothetical protein